MMPLRKEKPSALALGINIDALFKSKDVFKNVGAFEEYANTPVDQG